MIPLAATKLATGALPARHPHIHETQYRTVGALTVSSIGIGTRMGTSDDATDEAIERAIARYLLDGGNIIDAAISDRAQHSERAVGRALARELSTGRVARREVVLCSKGGFLPTAKDAAQEYIDRGIVDERDVAGGIHCMSPAFLAHQIGQSRMNLQSATIDLYYLHNPETQAAYVTRATMIERIEAAIETLEEATAAGIIGRYGISTWHAFRVPPGQPEHLELEDLVAMAERIAGSRHHLCAVQLPYNALMPEAAFRATQTVRGNSVSILEAADELGVDVIISTPLAGGRLAAELPLSFRHAFTRFPSEAQRALDFVMSTPHVASVMVGMRELMHVEQNCALLHEPALSSLQWAAEVDRLGAGR